MTAWQKYWNKGHIMVELIILGAGLCITIIGVVSLIKGKLNMHNFGEETKPIDKESEKL